jgi:hypothetical protein
MRYGPIIRGTPAQCKQVAMPHNPAKLAQTGGSMTTKIPRNDPCPCGSGKKHKNCCLGKTVITPKRKMGAVLALVVGIAGGLAAYKYSDWATGLSVGVGTLVIAGLVLMFSNPPPPSGGGDAGAINFGG